MAPCNRKDKNTHQIHSYHTTSTTHLKSYAVIAVQIHSNIIPLSKTCCKSNTTSNFEVFNLRINTIKHRYCYNRYIGFQIAVFSGI
ncbi:hypothetical protein HanPI659440_Chr03g0094921 [Helianthus annuus]|nr:hypothetical protein HanPI659440_Chr03g0094921 [Helianthus annuus]